MIAFSWYEAKCLKKKVGETFSSMNRSANHKHVTIRVNNNLNAVKLLFFRLLVSIFKVILD